MKLFRISKLFSLLFAVRRYITCTLLTRSPLNTKSISFDLHVLGTPPALILSQDQTLHKISLSVYTDFKLLILSCPAHKLLCIPNIFPPSLEGAKIFKYSFPLFNF